MTGLIIIGIIFLVLAVILLTPAQVRVSYRQGDLQAVIRYGPVKVQVFPLKKPEEEPEKKKKKKSEKKKKASRKKEKKPKKNRVKINREQILYALEKLPPILGRTLRCAGRRILIMPLRADVLVAGTNPADTAILYGRLTTALAAGLPVLQRTLRIREQEINLYPDFAGDRMDFAVDAGVSMRPWDLLVIGACAGPALIRCLIGFRKLASPLPEEKQETAGEAA